MNPLKNCIAIPERIHQGDFVLKLTEGIAQQQTLHDYVVTPELVKSFEHAMDFTGQCAEPAGCRGVCGEARVCELPAEEAARQLRFGPIV